jgi:hypothetical protein
MRSPDHTVSIQSPPEESIVQSSAVAADFDGDGDKEIVIGDIAGWLYVATWEGSSWTMAWSRQTAWDLNAAGAPSGCAITNKSDVRSSVAIGDLDQNGTLEIIVTTGGSPAYHKNGGVLIYTFNSASPWSFSVVPGWPQPKTDDLGSGSGMRDPDGCWDGIEGSPVIGDLDGDGDMEVVVSSLDRHIYAWHHNGAMVAGWPIHKDNGDNILRGGLSSPALGDIDSDGLPEVVVGTNSPPWPEGSPQPSDYSHATVWAINGDSSNVPGWPVTTNNNVYSSPAIGDIDDDGALEVVVGSGPTREGGNGRWVYAWNPNGSAVSGWPKYTAGDVLAPPALGDLDGDDDLEVVVGCGREFESPPDCTLLYAWHGNGVSVSGFPMSPGNFVQPYSPILADYDGDGAVEILVVDQDIMGLAIVNHNGTLSGDTSFNVPSILYNPPLVDDVDDDGKLEIAMGGFAIYIYDTTTDATAARPWPMFHHDRHRTGNIHYRIDKTPPTNPTVSSSTHIPNVWSADNDVTVSWSGADDAESGIAGYYYTWDTAATTVVDEGDAWLDADVNVLYRTVGDSASWYFHIRAVNGARQLAPDTVHFGPLQVDTTPPTSYADAPPCAVSSVDVSWGGYDRGSELANYDVQVRQGNDGAWTNWKTATSNQASAYTDDTGYVYQFRSLGRDAVGNLELKDETTSDAQTWLTRYGFSGTVYNVREQPVFAAVISATPPVRLPAISEPQGGYLLCHQTSTTYAVTVSRAGFGSLPPMSQSSGIVSGLNFYMPPLDNRLTNGHFETGDWTGWTDATSSGSVSITSLAHTGAYAVDLSGGSSSAWHATLSQTASIPTTMTQATLSLMYQLSGDGFGEATVQGATQTLDASLSSTGGAWAHRWMDVEAFLGQMVTVVLRLNGSSGESGSLVLDEVSLGSAEVGVREMYLPLLYRK